MHITKHVVHSAFIATVMTSFSSMAWAEATHDHRHEHGGQIYQSSRLESKWLRNDDGDGTLKSELEMRIGTDENKLFVQLNAEKTESENTNYDTKFMYSRAMADFVSGVPGVCSLHQCHSVSCHTPTTGSCRSRR